MFCRRRTMGRTNNELNHFLNDNQEFADLINLGVYQGKEIISANDLSPEPTAVYIRNRKGKSREIYGDVCKRCRNGCRYQVFCVENEFKISYIMPVRVMNYEAGRYMEQVRTISARHEEGDYRSWSERSSGFCKDDRLHPIITLVLYWKRKPWDGAKSLGELWDLTDEERKYLSPFLQDYRINLVNMYDLKDSGCCRGQLKYVLKLLQLDGDRAAMRREVSANSEYANLKYDTGLVLSALLGDDKLREYVEKNGNGTGGFDMGGVFTETWNEGREIGLKAGKKYGMEQEKERGIRIFILDNLEERIPRERIILKLQRHYHLDESSAEKYYRRYSAQD